MKLLPTQTNEAALLHFGKEAVSLLEKGDFQPLADRFGYALAFERSPARAIQEDLRSCITEFRASSEQQLPVFSSMTVRYFTPNDMNLFAEVGCVFFAAENCPVLATLIVSISGQDKHVTLEDVTLASAQHT